MNRFGKAILVIMLATAMIFAGCGSAKSEDAAVQEDALTLNIAITNDENTLAPFTYV